jgi:hypothetical protein
MIGQGEIMAYIPVTPHIPQPPSPVAQELGRRIGELIDQYSIENPGLSTIEIQQALQIAAQQRGTNRAMATVLALLIGLILLGVLTFYFFLR